MTVKINKKEIKAFNFSGGECHVSLNGIDLNEKVEVQAFLNNSDEIMRLIMTVDAIRRSKPDAPIHLSIPYFPYARQDRVCNVGEAFSVEVMAGLINGLNCASVTIEDPHSLITPSLIRNVNIITQAHIVSSSYILTKLIQDKNLILLAPDKGAAPKTELIAENLHAKGIEIEILFAQKVRNVADGKITDTIIPEGIQGKNILIPDDICDGGGTFIELAKKLKAQGAEQLYLYITHGIFSKGLEPLREGFEHVYCKNSFINNNQPEFLTILEDV